MGLGFFYKNRFLRSEAEPTDLRIGNRELGPENWYPRSTQSGPYGSKNRKLRSAGIGIFFYKNRFLRSETEPTDPRIGNRELGLENQDPGPKVDLMNPKNRKLRSVGIGFFFIRIVF